MLPVWINRNSETAFLKRNKANSYRVRLVVAICAVIALVTLFWHSDAPSNTVNDPSKLASYQNNHASSISTQGKQRRLLLKVGGVPSEGFGSTLGFIRHGARIADMLEVDFAPVRTLDWEGLYSVMDELNSGVDFGDYNWNNMCNLHTAMAKRKEIWGNWTGRVDKLRTGVDRLVEEASRYSQHLSYNETWVNVVKERLSTCDVIIFADQSVHADGVWDHISRSWFSAAIKRNVENKYAQRGITPVEPKDLHVHYRWSDINQKIKDNDKKWKFNNTALEETIRSVEACLGRSVTTNVFMKRSKAQETVQQLRQITFPVRQTADIIEGEDDIADLYHLSKAKILAITGGSYSNTAAAIGNPILVIHNGVHMGTYKYLRDGGTVLVQEGSSLSAEQCQIVASKM